MADDAPPATAPLPDKPAQPLRVGFISVAGPANVDALSGMPAAAARALEARGVEVVSLAPDAGSNRHGAALVRAATSPSQRATARWLWRRSLETLRAPFDYTVTLEQVRRQSRAVQKRLDRADVDVLVGVCISASLYALETDLPLIYSSDATARLIFETYPGWARRSKGYQRACDEIERACIGRIDAGIFASPATRASAVRDYGLAPERAHVVPFGATVLPEPGEVVEPDAPGRAHIALALVAADPVRKRLDLCIEVVERLSLRGVSARLHYIGPPTRRAKRSPLVTCHGPLRLSNTTDRARHRDVLRRSHLLLLPSLGEMYGIAPCEAAHFGRPSLVSDVGGLPSVVEDGRTGRVLPRDADADAYAHEVQSLCDHPDRYRALSRAARQRAQEHLTWDAWAARTLAITQQVLAVRRRKEIDPSTSAQGKSHV